MKKWFKPKVKKYFFGAMVQFDEHDNLVICGCKVRFLGDYWIYAVNEERAEKKFWKMINKKYPEYGDMILQG